MLTDFGHIQVKQHTAASSKTVGWHGQYKNPQKNKFSSRHACGAFFSKISGTLATLPVSQLVKHDPEYLS